jgi:hypothetical protein
MFKPLLLGTCVALLVSGCANTTPRTYLADDPPRAAGTRCAMTTGSHIRSRDNRCTVLHGRVYTRADIARTGALTTADALARLDNAAGVGPTQ